MHGAVSGSTSRTSTIKTPVRHYLCKNAVRYGFQLLFGCAKIGCVIEEHCIYTDVAMMGCGRAQRYAAIAGKSAVQYVIYGLSCHRILRTQSQVAEIQKSIMGGNPLWLIEIISPSGARGCMPGRQKDLAPSFQSDSFLKIRVFPFQEIPAHLKLNGYIAGLQPFYRFASHGLICWNAPEVIAGTADSVAAGKTWSVLAELR